MDWTKVTVKELESGKLDTVQDLKCPFCNEDSDFDAIGLKYHLVEYCPVYWAIDISGV